MTNPPTPTLRQRLEPGRLVAGALIEFGIKAYGVGAALAVALSDAETVRGKAGDAIAAVPTLVDEYRDAQYVREHREEIAAAVDYLNDNTPSQEELQAAADEGGETLRSLETTYSEVLQAKDAVDDFTPNPIDAYGHLREAWEAKPDLASIDQLAGIAEQTGPLVDQVQILLPVYEAVMVPLVDNFASDEIVGTLGVMAAALGVAFLLAQAVGFWVRRGRPGLLARVTLGRGATVWHGWYVDNLHHALTPPVYEAARARLQRDLLADPEATLDPEALVELRAWFDRTGG